MAMAMACRDFVPSDQAAVRDLVLAGLAERWGAAFDLSFNSDLDDLRANYVDRGGQIRVIESHHGIIATGTLMPGVGDVGRLVRISVAGTHRRLGLGRAVVADLLERARRAGMPEVVVKTDTPWSSALALYRSCGFTEVRRDAVDTHFAIHLPPE
jgi:GNAT superfamily N-acetyltransferase